MRKVLSVFLTLLALLALSSLVRGTEENRQ